MMPDKNETSASTMTPRGLIERGFYIFPILPGGKTPYAGSWKDYITNDAETAEHMHAGLLRIPSVNRKTRQPVEVDFSGCNFAIATGPSDLIVVDIDTKDGKDGRPHWKALTEKHGLPPNTLMVKSPSGGYHLIFSGKCKMGTDCLLGTGIDIRSHGSYIVAPGQHTVAGQKTCEGDYEIVQDLPVAPCPQWIIDAQGLPTDRVEIIAVPGEEMTDAQLVELESALATLTDCDYDSLLHRGMEIHNEYPGPDGLQAWTDWCADVYPDHDASICEYKWDTFGHAKEGDRTIASLFHAARENGWTGVGAADLDWGNAQPYVAPVPIMPQPLPQTVLRNAGRIIPKNIPPRQWILGKRYLRRYVTQIVAPGGVGKSTLSLIDAISITIGRDLLTGEKVEQGNIWFHNAEDPCDETEMRIAAICKHYGLSISDVKDRLFYTSGRDIKIQLAIMDRGMAIVNSMEYERMRDLIRENDITLFYGDPMIRMHGVDENSNKEMDVFVEALTRLAEECQIGICVVHHTRKLNGADGTGDMDSGRGASSVVSGVRVQFTLTKMDEKAAKKFGLDPERRGWYVRLADGKANLAPPLEHQIWFERESVQIENGEEVGVLKLAELRRVEKVDLKVEERMEIAKIVAREKYLAVGRHSLREFIRDLRESEYWHDFPSGESPGERTLADFFSSQADSVLLKEQGIRLSIIYDANINNTQTKYWIIGEKAESSETMEIEK